MRVGEANHLAPLKVVGKPVAVNNVNTPDWLSDESIEAFMASVAADQLVAA